MAILMITMVMMRMICEHTDVLEQQVLDHHDHDVEDQEDDDDLKDGHDDDKNADDDDDDSGDLDEDSDDDDKVNLPMVGRQLERRILAAASSRNYLQALSSSSSSLSS